MIRGIDEKTRRTSRTTWRRENSQLTEALSTACQRYHIFLWPLSSSSSSSYGLSPASTSSPPAVIVVVIMLVDWRSNIFDWQRRRWRPTSPTTSPWIMSLRLPQTPPPVDFESQINV
ncbi:hypothetical protein Q3G72_034021 [Acer saccharum]|nr:hypothetical protein Q3G72_034021 [Acer saccharum]